MTLYEAFSCLGIPMTKDVSAIKKAYQKLVPQHHPEVDPQGFMRLHQAYKTALAYAKDTELVHTRSVEFSWKPEKFRPAREETGYDSLFSNLEEKTTTDISQQKKEFSRKLLLLKLHWLPIPVKSWQKFFNSEAFLLCRGDRESMASLFELLVNRIHSYGVFHFLMERLWELEGWQESENMADLTNITRKCIVELLDQYKGYMELNSSVEPIQKLLTAVWYYQAMPFYFKLIASVFLIPVLSCGSVGLLFLLILVFYILEICIWVRKYNRQLGLFRLTMRLEKGGVRYRRKGDSELLGIATIFAIVFHFAGCLQLFIEINGGL